MFFLFKHNLFSEDLQRQKHLYKYLLTFTHTQCLLTSSLWFEILRQAFRLYEPENEPHEASKLPITCTSVIGNWDPQIHILATGFLTLVDQNASPTRLSRWIRTHLCKTFLKNVWWIIKFRTYTVPGGKTVINHAIWLKWIWVPGAHHHAVGDFSHCHSSNRLGCPSPGICLGHESPGTIIQENTRNIHIPRWKSPITWENSWHADDVRIHVLIVMFPPLIWNHTLPMSVSPLSQNYVYPAREPATHLICYHPDLLQLLVLCSKTSNDGFQ